YPTPDDVLAAVGYGKASVHQLLNKLAPGATLDTVERPRAAAGTRPKTDQGARIRGVDDLLVRFAKCCNPLPGDQIVGFSTRRRGINNFVVEVADLSQVQDIMTAIREVPDVINVERVRGL